MNMYIYIISIYLYIYIYIYIRRKGQRRTSLLGYWENSIITESNSNIGRSRMIEDDFCKLGDGSLSHMFRCKSKRCQFQEDFCPQDRVISII